MTQKRRLLELDALRGIAALLVALYHYTTRYDDLFGHQVNMLFDIPWGHYGVQLFFVISGFVIFMTLEKTQRPMDFIVSRFSRIFPAYWSALIVTGSFLFFFDLPGREFELFNFIVNLSMLQEWFFIPHIDGVYWTLTIEITFYAIMLIIYLSKGLPHIEIISGIWLIVLVLIQYLKSFELLVLPSRLDMLLLNGYAQFFISGMMFYRLRHSLTLKRNLLIIISTVVSLITADLMLFYVHSMVAIIFYLIHFQRISLLANPLFVYFGTISYSFYLVHQNIGYLVIRYLYEFTASFYLIIILPLFVSISLASLITWFIEKPALSAIRIYYKGLSQSILYRENNEKN
mgnify:CR=1 FL=1